MSSAAPINVPVPIQLDYDRAPAPIRTAPLMWASALLAVSPLFQVRVWLAIQFSNRWGPLLSWVDSYVIYLSRLSPLLVLLAVIVMGRSMPRQPGRSRVPFFLCLTLAIGFLTLHAVGLTIYLFAPRWRSLNPWCMRDVVALEYLCEVALYLAAWMFVHRLAQRVGRTWLKKVSAIAMPLCMFAGLNLAAPYVVAGLEEFMGWPSNVSPRFWIYDGNGIYAVTYTQALIQFVFFTTLAIAAPRLKRRPL